MMTDMMGRMMGGGSMMAICWLLALVCSRWWFWRSW